MIINHYAEKVDDDRFAVHRQESLMGAHPKGFGTNDSAVDAAELALKEKNLNPDDYVISTVYREGTGYYAVATTKASIEKAATEEAARKAEEERWQRLVEQRREENERFDRGYGDEPAHWSMG